MLKKFFATFFAAAILLSVSGCISTLADVRSAKGSGVSRTYAASQEEVWKTVPLVLVELGLQFVSEDKQKGHVLAQHAGKAFVSYEANVAIFIESVNGATRTRVEVVSKPIDSTQIFAPGWGNDILNKLDEKLNSRG